MSSRSKRIMEMVAKNQTEDLDQGDSRKSSPPPSLHSELEDAFSSDDSVFDVNYKPSSSESGQSDDRKISQETPTASTSTATDDLPSLTADDNGDNTNLARKKKRKPSSWKRNSQKKLRMQGKPYLTQRGKPKAAQTLKDVNCHCHYKCNNVFSLEERQSILTSFLLLGTEELRWNFIARHVKIIPKKRAYSADNSDRRTFTYVYTLTLNQVPHQVCQKFFISTLNISSKKVRTAINKLTSSGTIEADKRGRKSPPQKKPESVKNVIRDHIRSMPVVASHYCRSSTKRKYLATGLSENRLYNDYKKYCEELGVQPEKPSYYKYIFTTEFNLGFHRPKKDQCDYCTVFSNKQPVEKELAQHDYNLHIIRKQEAREHKDADKAKAKSDDSFICYAMDMEKILVTPSLQIGKLYYTQKLKTFNFTVYNLGTSEVNNFMWHEGVGTKGSSEIATCLWKSLSTLDPAVKEVTFYADTASGQNRNSINAAMFLRAVTILPLAVINQKFMESGHSEMECDSVHSSIENRGNKVDVFTPEGWYTVARTAKVKQPLYQVTPMDFTEFMDFKDFASKIITNRNKTEDGTILNWLKVKWLQYRKEDPSRIYFKERLSDSEFKSIRIKLRATTRKDAVSLTQQTIPRLYNRNLKIDKKKITSLRRLCSSGSIPSAYHAFYEQYLQSDDEDNVNMVDSSEEET